MKGSALDPDACALRPGAKYQMHLAVFNPNATGQRLAYCRLYRQAAADTPKLRHAITNPNSCIQARSTEAQSCTHTYRVQPIQHARRPALGTPLDRQVPLTGPLPVAVMHALRSASAPKRDGEVGGAALAAVLLHWWQ